MARKISPFAALTNEEKQIKWMEYQSIRLPYTEVSDPERLPQESASCIEKRDNCNSIQSIREENVFEKNEKFPPERKTIERPIPPPEVMMTQTKQTYQQKNALKTSYSQANELLRSRHNQYDAVIERMKKAEQSTGNYINWQ